MHKQAAHTEDTLQLLSIDLKKTLLNLTQSLFGKGKNWVLVVIFKNKYDVIILFSFIVKFVFFDVQKMQSLESSLVIFKFRKTF